MDEQKQSSSQLFYRIVPETDKNILVTDFFLFIKLQPKEGTSISKGLPHSYLPADITKFLRTYFLKHLQVTAS